MAARKKTAPKRGASRAQAASAKKPVHPLIWVVTGLIVGVFVMSLFRLEPGNDAIKRDKSADDAKQPASTAPEPSTNKPKFEFYTLLSESEVIVPMEALPEKTPPPPTKIEVEAAKKADAVRAQAILDGKTPPVPVVKKEENGKFKRNEHGEPASPDRPGYPNEHYRKVIEETGDKYKVIF